MEVEEAAHMMETDSPDEAGPLFDKEKGPDPQNWGDLEFSDRELDEDAQQYAIAH